MSATAVGLGALVLLLFGAASKKKPAAPPAQKTYHVRLVYPSTMTIDDQEAIVPEYLRHLEAAGRVENLDFGNTEMAFTWTPAAAGNASLPERIAARIGLGTQVRLSAVENS